MESDANSTPQSTRMFKSLFIADPSFGFIPFPQPKNIDDKNQGVDDSTKGTLKITEYAETACSSITGVKKTPCSSDDRRIVGIDMDVKDPLLCPNLDNDNIFENLFLDEMEKRPQKSYMEKVQKHIHPPTRASFIDWLAGVAEKLCYFPNTLHLAVTYMDRYLSRNEVDRKEWQLLGLTCVLIASPSCNLDAYVLISKGMFCREDFIQMMKSVSSYLNYEFTVPTTWIYLKRFVPAAQGAKESSAVHGLQCMARYIAELSLLPYDMLQFSPYKIAASSVFLTLYIVDPSKRPWNANLVQYTGHHPSQLRDCVLALHGFCYKFSCSSGLSKIKSKYSQRKYDCVALKSFPPSIPPEFFQNL